MATERVERRLAAILAADVAGYSRLMGADEEGTLAQLKVHRRTLVDPKIKQHRGRIPNNRVYRRCAHPHREEPMRLPSSVHADTSSV